MVKRIFDLLASLIGCLLLFPVIVLIAVINKLDSTGPVFYLQDRVGKNGKLFKLIKFRSIHVNADKLAAITVGKRDPRVTRVGYFLRKYKIDELVQLLNVLKGDMSLVGPRPELKRFVDLYSEEQWKVLTVKPGITDLASIHYRNENEMLEGKSDPIDFYIREIMPHKLQLNLKYIREQSLWLDIRIIFNTIFSIFKKNQ